MGVCASCLGRDHAQPLEQDSETSRLLHDGSRQPNYGLTPNGVPATATAIDPLDVLREEAALKEIVKQTSDKFLDILALERLPPDAPVSDDETASDARIQYYQRLMEQVCEPKHSTELAVPRSQGSISDNEVNWTADGDEMTRRLSPLMRPLNSEGVGPLVGEFRA